MSRRKIRKLVKKGEKIDSERLEVRYVSGLRFSQEDIDEILNGHRQDNEDDTRLLINLFLSKRGKYRGRLKAHFKWHLKNISKNVLSMEIVNNFRSLFRIFFPEPHFPTVSDIDMFVALSTLFFTGSFSGKYLELYNALRRTEERQFLSEISNSAAQDLRNVQLCGINVPHELICILLSFLPDDYDKICDIGTLNRSFLFLVLTFWKKVKITPKNAKGISVLVLKNVKEVTLAGNFDFETTKYVFENLNRHEVLKVDLKNMSTKRSFQFQNLTEKDLSISFPKCEFVILPEVNLKNIPKYYNYNESNEKSQKGYKKDCCFKWFFMHHFGARKLKRIEGLYVDEAVELLERGTLDMSFLEQFTFLSNTDRTEKLFDWSSWLSSKTYPMLEYFDRLEKKKGGLNLNGEVLVKLGLPDPPHRLIRKNKAIVLPVIFRIFPDIERLEIDFVKTFRHRRSVRNEKAFVLNLEKLNKLRELKIMENRNIENKYVSGIFDSIKFSRDLKRFDRFAFITCSSEVDVVYDTKRMILFKDVVDKLLSQHVRIDTLEFLGSFGVKANEMRRYSRHYILELRKRNYDKKILGIVDELFCDKVVYNVKTGDGNTHEMTKIKNPLFVRFVSGKNEIRELLVKLDLFHPFLSFRMHRRKVKMTDEIIRKQFNFCSLEGKEEMDDVEFTIFEITIDGDREELLVKEYDPEAETMTTDQYLKIKKELFVAMFGQYSMSWRSHFFACPFPLLFIRSLEDEQAGLNHVLQSFCPEGKRYRVKRVDLDETLSKKLDFRFKYPHNFVVEERKKKMVKSRTM